MANAPNRSRADAPAAMGIDLVELETFIAVAQAESFSAAAGCLHVTQPTVTGRIQRLEAALGTSLLRRTTRKVETTPQGALLLTEAVNALESLSRVVQGFRKTAQQARQRVIVAATPSLSAVTLPPIIHTYSERFPDVEIQLRDLQHAAALAAVDDGSADLGVLALESDDSRFRFQTLWTDDMLLVAPLNHALAGIKSVRVEELAGQTLLVVEQHQGLRDRIAHTLEVRGLSLPTSKVVANLNTLLGMLKAGMGVSLIPRSVVTRGLRFQHSMIEIDGIDLSRRFGIVVARRTKLNAAGLSFCRHLRQATAELLDRAGAQ